MWVGAGISSIVRSIESQGDYGCDDFAKGSTKVFSGLGPGQIPGIDSGGIDCPVSLLLGIQSSREKETEERDN